MIPKDQITCIREISKHLDKLKSSCKDPQAINRILDLLMADFANLDINNILKQVEQARHKADRLASEYYKLSITKELHKAMRIRDDMREENLSVGKTIERLSVSITPDNTVMYNSIKALQQIQQRYVQIIEAITEQQKKCESIKKNLDDERQQRSIEITKKAEALKNSIPSEPIREALKHLDEELAVIEGFDSNLPHEIKQEALVELDLISRGEANDESIEKVRDLLSRAYNDSCEAERHFDKMRTDLQQVQNEMSEVRRCLHAYNEQMKHRLYEYQQYHDEYRLLFKDEAMGSEDLQATVSAAIQEYKRNLTDKETRYDKLYKKVNSYFDQKQAIGKRIDAMSRVFNLPLNLYVQ